MPPNFAFIPCFGEIEYEEIVPWGLTRAFDVRGMFTVGFAFMFGGSLL